MFSEEIEIIGLDPDHWARFLEWTKAAALPKGGNALALLLTRDHKIRPIRSSRGDGDALCWEAGTDLALIRQETGADTAILVDVERLSQSIGLAEGRVPWDGPFLLQCAPFLSALADEVGHGIRLDPPLHHDWLLRALRHLPGLVQFAGLPSGTCLVALWRKGCLWSSLVLAFEDREIQRLSSLPPEAFPSSRKSLAGLHKTALEHVTTRGGPAAFGLSVDADWFDAQAAGKDRVDLLLQGIAGRRIILSPIPLRWNLALSGLKAVRAIERLQPGGGSSCGSGCD